MKRLLFILFQILHAQQFNRWYFGHSVGLEFNGGSAPVSISSPIRPVEACAVISDNSGNTLFSTDGQRVWDGFNQLVTGVGLKRDTSGTQGAVAVPRLI